MSFVLSNLHMSKLSNGIEVSTIKQLVDGLLLFFITHNAKTEACEVNSDWKNKPE